MKNIYNRFHTLFRYRELFFQLVSRDIKLKYRRSILGYFWSVLSPLLTMIVLVIVFSSIFRFDIEFFPVYILIGKILFSFLSAATTSSLSSITRNINLLKKIYVPKYIFTLSSITSELVNLLFMLFALFIVMFATGVPFSFSIIFIIIPIIQIYIFCLGIGLFLAQAVVFFRDVKHIWSVIVTAWMYLSAIFYPVSILPENLYFIVTKFNPLYFYIALFRNYIFGDLNSGNIDLIIRGTFAAIIMLLIGIISFSLSKKKFILYM